MTDNPFEIPQALRDVSEQNLKQVRAAYEQLVNFMIKAMGPWMAAMPSNPIADSFKDVQGRAMQIAMENAELAFTFAGKISNAQTVEEVVTLQTQFAQERMQAFVTQTQQLYSAIAEAFQKSERGTMGVSMGAMPSNLNSLKSHDRLQGRKRPRRSHGEDECRVSISLGRKDRQGTNFQDVFGLQSRFAKEQMQAYAGQTQEIQKLIRESLQKLQHG